MRQKTSLIPGVFCIFSAGVTGGERARGAADCREGERVRAEAGGSLRDAVWRVPGSVTPRGTGDSVSREWVQGTTWHSCQKLLPAAAEQREQNLVDWFFLFVCLFIALQVKSVLTSLSGDELVQLRAELDLIKDSFSLVEFEEEEVDEKKGEVSVMWV